MDIEEKRKRRRKSQSFKLVMGEEFGPSYVTHSSCKNPYGEQDAAVPDVWPGDDSMEIKKQITGMMRLLADKTSRVYQRVEKEQDSISKTSPDVTYVEPAASSAHSKDWRVNSCDSTGNVAPSALSRATPIHHSPTCNYSSKDMMIKVDDAHDVVPGAPCCVCNCKGTLQAILQELRTMRRLMQAQRVSSDQPCQPRLGPGPAPYHRPRKTRPIFKVAKRAVASSLEVSPLTAAPTETEKGEECGKILLSSIGRSEIFVQPQHSNLGSINNTHQLKAPQATEVQSEVRLAEDYDVFISKAQLDSILVNYTRSGSLLFRKLVCAFFDDATLAISLPNGKRKRGLNDNRKGLDPNIVGAIKMFTEKYCNEHRIEKLPGPRDWVQILQDQIKLARRRLKRDAAEDVLNGPSSCMVSVLQIL
ncbi:BEN domain-containing protein 7 isoform X2 [Dunckerocampus dactyliophorus]|uniref:BEN domain-containing protein 7 isoform X2 n=1 Tax=Dunckerocampus dactyliophorus TaxID=161453 RepID=UPI002406A9F7|nr:BEN domain-containing protein 7 isoform X2 [Dunckerocampus dactyliophorus]